LGGFPHFSAHPYGWLQVLGFRMENPLLSRVAGAGPVMHATLYFFKAIPFAASEWKAR